ncbi:hypothetical protein K491DRAFT_682464 [Lophiostoma macrostomum CBS 122681]|uniref:Prion-inhibition and propagation HeLo domain-containing protein n=1 Tax=Lophiostoma macrostomum CBS 122681 TaxID=1314788 RepID=A0A6A6SU45_9PLEO|nr:hypothetical protein K491DRAFT_682464 [Lophiostoma macrostomum CBS 122681]
MSEPTGIVLRVNTLARAFNHAVNCFCSICLGQNFENDFKTYIIQLELTKLRLTRWGNALGLTDINDDTTLEQTDLSKSQMMLGTRGLQRISDIFAAAEKTAENLLDHKEFEQEQCLDDRHEIVRSLLEKLSLSRLSNISPSKVSKTKWALYKKEEFDSLINGVTTLITQLEANVKPPSKKIETLCDEELASIGTEDKSRINILTPLVAELDKSLLDAIKKFRREQEENASNFMYSVDNQGLQANEDTRTVTGYLGGPDNWDQSKERLYVCLELGRSKNRICIDLRRKHVTLCLGSVLQASLWCK